MPIHSTIISFARYSPDGRQIAFIKIPDTQTPFTVGELWVMNADGSNARKLADADAGHGYAANWSPDGKRIAFVVRENPEDEQADQSSDALISNIYIVDVESGALTQVTHLEDGRVETPFWSPDGNTLAFNVVINDRMEVRIADLDNRGDSVSYNGINLLSRVDAKVSLNDSANHIDPDLSVGHDSLVARGSCGNPVSRSDRPGNGSACHRSSRWQPRHQPPRQPTEPPAAQRQPPNVASGTRRLLSVPTDTPLPTLDLPTEAVNAPAQMVWDGAAYLSRRINTGLFVPCHV